MRVVCVELEPKFVALARQNVALHARDWAETGRPIPQILEGDSRQLRAVLARADVVVSSPPYAGKRSDGGFGGYVLEGVTIGQHLDHGNNYGVTPGQLADLPSGDVNAVISSPPYAGSLTQGNRSEYDYTHYGGGGQLAHRQRYGETAGQLSEMAEGAVDAVVTSPPFRHARSDTQHSVPATGGGPATERHFTTQDGGGYGDDPRNLEALATGDLDAVVSSPPYPQPYTGGGGINVTGFGPDGADKVGARTYQSRGADRADGNLETLESGKVDGVISSPPYEAQPTQNGGALQPWPGRRRVGASQNQNDGYGETAGQLGGEQGETFWTAALQIVRECYAILKPGGVAVWIVKAFVRDKAIVDFPGDWRRLCEYAGFETIREIHASLVHEETIPGLFHDKTIRRERKSFFRRLAEKKGSPRIDHEVVWIMKK